MRSLKNISFLLFLVGFPLMLFSQSKTYKVFSPASKILVISGHPHLENSNVNKVILKELEKHFGEHISIRRLDQLYHDYQNQYKSRTRSYKEC